MSETAQGPGWWQASDGKWYPPQNLPPPPGQIVQPAKGRSGCAVAAIVVAVAFGVIFVLALLSIIAITFLGRSTADKLSNLEGEIESGAPTLVRRAT